MISGPAGPEPETARQETGADVVIAGYGPAGASAAIAAHDAGARVIVVDSAARGGGNARYSGGFLCDLPADRAVEHLDALCFGRTGRRVLEAYADGLHDLDGWLRSLGATTVPFEPPPVRLPAPFPSWPGLPGGQAIRYRTVAGSTGATTTGAGTSGSGTTGGAVLVTRAGRSS